MLRRKSIKIIKRAVKWTGLTLALTAGVASVGLYMLTSSINNDDMRTLLGQEFKAATGRSLAIEGAISIEPGLLPVIEIGAVSFSNAAWSDNPVMLRAEQVVGRFSLLQLIRGSFVLDEIHIQDVSLLLETDVEGRNNWGFEGVATAGPEFLVQPSTTPSDQVNDLLSFLLSITSFVDEFHINDLSVRYTNDDRKINQTYDIAWARLESADQDSRLVLDVGAGAARRNQTLHVEIYDGADFHAGNGDLGLAVAIDAVKWKAQATGILTPARNATSVDLEASLEATDAVALYHDLGEMIVLPAWPDVPEKMALDFKSSVRGSLSHPVMDNTTLVVDGNQGSRISFSGMVDDFLNEGSISGQVSATVNDPVAYAAGLADFPVFLKDMKDIDFGDAVIAGDLGGRLVSPILKNATLDWGTKKTMITSARNLTLGASPFTLSSELSITIQNEHFISTYLWNVLPPPFDKLPSIPGGVSLNASIDTSPDGRLDAEGVELEFGQGSALKASLSGRVGDVLGRVDPNVTISIASESDRFIHDMATALAPEDWANRVLPVAPLSGEATLQRDEAGRLAMSVSSLDFGDPDVAHVSLNGKLSGLTSLDEVELVAHVMAQDGKRLRHHLLELLPNGDVLNRLPFLDEIDMTGTAKRNKGDWAVPSFTLNTHGELPLTVSMRGAASLEPELSLNGSWTIEGPDMYRLRHAVDNALSSEPTTPYQLEKPLSASEKGFRVAAEIITGKDTLRVPDLFVRFGSSRLAAKIDAADLSSRPKMTFSIRDASFHLPEINDLLTPENAEAEVNEEVRIFQTQRYDLPILAEVDMSLSATGEVIGIDSPVFNTFDLVLNLDQGRFLLRRFLGVTTNGTLDLSGEWNIAGPGTPEMALDLDVKDISLGLLLHRTEVADWLRGAPMSGTVKGRLVGRSFAELASSLTGQVVMSVGPGEIDKSVIDWLGGDLISTIYSNMNPFAETTPHSQLICLEAQLPFVDGVSEFERKIALETKRVAMMASGRIDLGQESMDLSLASTPKEDFGTSLGGSLIRLKGRLDDPKFSLDTWEASKKAISVGTSILTGGVSSLLETIFNRLTRETNLCQTVVGSVVPQ